jgi:hypothetical protein
MEIKIMKSRQSVEDITKICKHWVQYVAPVSFPGYVDDRHNGDVLHTYIQSEFDGFYSLANLSKVAKLNESNLHGLGVAESAEVKAARAKEAADKAEVQRLEKVAAEQDRVIQTWLRDNCPQGLKSSNGQPYVGDVDRIREFLNRNYKGEITIESLNDAVSTLSNVLTWFSRKPEDMQIRGIKPKERILSDKMKRESGMLLPERQQDHANDGKFNSPEKLIRLVAQEELRRRGITTSPIMAEADAIVVQNRRGKVDAVKTAEIRQIMVYTNGKLDEAATLRARNKAADEAELAKNRI